jgi:5-methylcytosine-specific restriction endonuclease McrA
VIVDRPLRSADREYVAYRRIVQRDPCSYCGGRGGTKDHIIARSQGSQFARDPGNLTGACRECNMDKGSLDLLGFLFQRHWGVSLREARLEDVMWKMIGFWMP